MTKMKRVLFLALMALPLVSCGTAPTLPATEPVFEVTAVAAEAVPADFDGRCPRTISFVGTITANRSGVAGYQWVDGDGDVTGRGSVTFRSAGSMKVTMEWRRRVSDGVSQVLRVVAPNVIESNRVGFRRCS